MSPPTERASIEEALQQSLIVIPSINGGPLLDRMLPTLRVPGRMVVVLDQGSTDNTAEVCGRHGVEIVQLGEPKTYTEACNLGIELAKARGCEFIFFSNNDIVFTTDVARELLGELIEDENLGIVAPSQVLVNSANGTQRVSYRSFWDLQRLKFAHDYTAPPLPTKRLESDFCELTFALARVDVLSEIGGLDNEYGFYHEDADLGFRLRDAGYACAYLPQSQIVHYAGSTFGAESERRTAYILRSKATFARKHLGYGVRHRAPTKDVAGFDASVARHLHLYLARYGLLDEERSELAYSHRGNRTSNYSYSSLDAPILPVGQDEVSNPDGLALATSEWATDVLRAAGFKNANYVPLGIETDIFHPWGPSLRLVDTPGGGTTFLWVGRDRHQDGLDVLLDTWSLFFRRYPDSRLVLVGSDIVQNLDTLIWHANGGVIRRAPDMGITIYETLADFDAATIAAIYRGVDFLVCTSSSEVLSSVVAESLACATPAIFINEAASTKYAQPESLTLEAGPPLAKAGVRQEPTPEALLERLVEATQMAGEAYNRLAAAGVRLIRAKHTWRDTVMATRRALAGVQSRKSVVPADPTAAAKPAPRQRESIATSIARRTVKFARRVSKMAGGLLKHWLRGQ